MELEFPLEQTVKTRRSVRTYENRGLAPTEKDRINAYMANLTNPFAIDVSFRLLEKEASADGEKLGTYGVIKGAGDYIGATVAAGGLNLEALGYSFEKLILYSTSLGLGTCWLGGTFNRSGFAAAMKLKEGELFPCISPIGYPISKMRTVESLMRWAVKSDQRKEWKDLFFRGGLTQPLSPAEAGEFAFPLEMVRLAPSASNKQPWRIVQDQGAYHFYKAGTAKIDKGTIDMHRIDMGIAACHFHLAALSKGLPGSLQKLDTMATQGGEQLWYTFSWVVS